MKNYELLKECYDLIMWLSQWYYSPEPRKRIDDVLEKLRAAQPALALDVPQADIESDKSGATQQ